MLCVFAHREGFEIKAGAHLFGHPRRRDREFIARVEIDRLFIARPLPGGRHGNRVERHFFGIDVGRQARDLFIVAELPLARKHRDKVAFIALGQRALAQQGLFVAVRDRVDAAGQFVLFKEVKVVRFQLFDLILHSFCLRSQFSFILSHISKDFNRSFRFKAPPGVHTETGR